MPELPEVETVRRTLKNFIIGKKIKDIRVYYAKIVVGDSKIFVESLKGQTIRDIDRVGKYLIFILVARHLFLICVWEENITLPTPQSR